MDRIDLAVDFSLWDRSQHLEVVKSPQGLIFMPLSRPSGSLFPYYWPTPICGFFTLFAYGREGPMDKWEAAFPPHQIIGFAPVPGLVLNCKFALLTYFHYSVAVDA